jgi:hypothetical protein
MKDLMDVLQLLLLPTECYHVLHWRLTLRIRITKVFENCVILNVPFVVLITLS